MCVEEWAGGGWGKSASFIFQESGRWQKRGEAGWRRGVALEVWCSLRGALTVAQSLRVHVNTQMEALNGASAVSNK